ncbi:MAG TPA: 16S rRNA (cytosine(1402)-N(4))-methyltransferase RsmH [Dermatophilaceae bacterium]|jgi:16S rRNA (cytosine1402-N4)-methyltransferase|nr:16S rRNA (cytosine(1402)-N(4))-methyltransferase RsmH [Dermatophilaceae bacterium]
MAKLTADRHTPVMRARILELLAPACERSGAVVVDGTLGMGGHAEGILEAFPDARLIGIDRDREALTLAGERLAAFSSRVHLAHAIYDVLPQVLQEAGESRIDAAIFDLGVSSLHLDEPDRGFAYRLDAPLDMRMDQSTGLTAADVLNTYEAARLERIIKEYGEERYARAIVKAVVVERERAPFVTSAPLVELLKRVVPAASQRSGGHPAKRTFQALRIEVNAELDAWRRALPAAIDALRLGGRIAVLSYHSLEDRITKRGLAHGAVSRAAPGMPVERAEDAAYLRLLTRGAEVPTETEVADNPRAASARLRAAERIRDTQGASR